MEQHPAPVHKQNHHTILHTRKYVVDSDMVEVVLMSTTVMVVLVVVAGLEAREQDLMAQAMTMKVDVVEADTFSQKHLSNQKGIY